MKPTWWEYIIIEDKDGVGIVKGFRKDTPKEIIEDYKYDMRKIKKAKKDDPYVML